MPDQSDVIVLGAGMVGVCTALELQKRGLSVVLVDRKEPGSETSHGNAGVLNRGSIVPLNNPALLRQLPAMLLGRKPGLTYRADYLVANTLPLMRFASLCRWPQTRRRASALHQLIDRSAQLFPGLMADAGAAARLATDGWLKLYRSSSVPADTSVERRLLDEHAVRYTVLGRGDISDLEPTLSGVHSNGLWIQDTAALDDPGETVRALARSFVRRGGTLYRGAAVQSHGDETGWTLHLSDGRTLRAGRLVVCLGPWSAGWLRQHGVRVPMIFERGAHREFEAPEQPLRRPVHDVDGAYVASPMPGRLRLCCGVTLAPLDGRYSPRQLDSAEHRMREAMVVGNRLGSADWVGARPSFPDALPALGPTRKPGLWLACGHQHVGMATAPASAELVADLMVHGTPAIEPAPFQPGRFGV